MDNKPVILIITGAWHIPEHYAAISSRFRHAGFIVHCPRLLTNNNAYPANKTLDDDVMQIKSISEDILSSGHNLVVLMHSYGGVVGSNAFADIGKSATPGRGKVIQLVYMAAFVPLEDEALAGAFGGGRPPWITAEPDGTLSVSDPAVHFYSDLDEEQQRHWSGQLVAHPTDAQHEGPKETNGKMAWRSLPCTYLFCRKDNALLLDVQEMLVHRAEQSSGGTVAFNRVYSDSGHSPMLSMPDLVVQVVSKAAT